MISQSSTPDYTNQIIAAFERFANAESWAESRAILKTRPEIRQMAAGDILKSYIASTQGRSNHHWLTVCFDVLRRSVIIGSSSHFTEIAALEIKGFEAEARQLIALNTKLQDTPAIRFQKVDLIPNMLDRLAQFPRTGLVLQVRGMLLIEYGDVLADLSTSKKRAANLERAIKSYSKALRCITAATSPVDYAEANYKLGVCYQIIQTGRRGADLARAAACYSKSLRIFTAKSAPEDYGKLKSNLGATYLERPSGDREADAERAIQCFRKAQKVFDAAGAPVQYGELEMRIGAAYLTHTAGNDAVNVDRAVRRFKKALRYLSPETAALPYARTQFNLAVAYAEYMGGNRRSNLKVAIDCYREALRFRTADASPTEYALTKSNLGNAYAHLAESGHNVVSNIKLAIGCYHDALRYQTAENAPLHFASTLTSLAKAYSLTAETRGEAIDFYERALGIRAIETVPAQHRTTAVLLGQLHFEDERWEEAHAAYSSAITAGEGLYRVTATETGRQAELSAVREAVPADAYCLARLGRLSDAVERLESGRTRALAEALTRDYIGLNEARAKDREAFVSARQRVKALEAEARAWPPEYLSPRQQGRSFLKLCSDIDKARIQLDRAADRIRAYSPDFMALGLSYSDIQSAASAVRPITYLLATVHGSLALIVSQGPEPSGTCEALWLAGITLEMIYQSGSRLTEYLKAQAAGDTAELRRDLKGALAVLRKEILQPLAEHLETRSVSQTTLIPVGRFTLLPLSAASPDGFTVALAPSAQAVLAARDALEERTTVAPKLLAVGEPTTSVSGLSPLPYARDEVNAVAGYFSAESRHILYPGRASLDQVTRQLTGVSHLHLACHGSFEPDSPLDSGLYLDGKDRLTLRQLLNGELDSSSVRLAVLSACESGINESARVPDEMIGLPTGFLQAGVPGVLATLWATDLSTAVFAKEFYRLITKEGTDPATALHRARIFLRDGTANELDLVGWFEHIYEESGRTHRDAIKTANYYRSHPQDRPFADAIHWAGLIFSGV